jgi:predicted metalloprotease
LDTSQVEDRRGQRALPVPGLGGLAAGGGGIGLLITLALLLRSGALTSGGLGGNLGALEDQTVGGGTTLSQECQTGADAIERQDCQMVAYINSIQQYWTDEYTRNGDTYHEARTTFFTDQVSTGCGFASSAVGPFYCPPDTQIYLDLGFFQTLEQQLGARGGPFAEAYVLAHEYGHHVQNLAGTLDRARDGGTGPGSAAIAVELQADCFAGAWASNAVSTGFIAELTPDDIARGLDAAAAVGDDRIQRQTEGRVTPDAFTHGTSEQRQRWFLTGYQSGDPGRCDTSGAL